MDDQAQLRDRVRVLEDENAELRRFLGVTRETFQAMAMHAFGLSPTQASLACSFYHLDVLGRYGIEEALYGDIIDPIQRSPNLVDVHLGQLRKRLGRFGIKIETRPSVGWLMPPEMKKRFAAKIAPLLPLG